MRIRDVFEQNEPATPLYLRLGDIPKGGKSTIGPLWMQQRNGSRFEKGVSVFDIEWDSEENRWALQGVNSATLEALLSQKRPAYLVTGKPTGYMGQDGETLLKNVKILKQLSYNEFYYPGWGIDCPPEEFLINYDADIEN